MSVGEFSHFKIFGVFCFVADRDRMTGDRAVRKFVYMFRTAGGESMHERFKGFRSNADNLR